MSKRPEKSWSLWCDWPGCEHQFEYDSYSIFGDGFEPEEVVTDADGLIDRDGKRHYCRGHRAAWASEHEKGEPFPQPPYLLIHDSDTGDADDDGKVTLIGSPS